MMTCTVARRIRWTLTFSLTLLFSASAGAENTHDTTADNAPDDDYTVACYYFPNYHPSDARNRRLKGDGWSEWELVKQAKPRFPGHQQPKVPLWGYTDESDPRAMARKIDAAADHGIDAFIFDWYWYDDGPFIEQCLDEGFLKAANNGRLKFALMWANHDWTDIHPYTRGTPRKTLYPGAVTRETFDTIVEHCIEKYFRHPSYWKIDGKPYFSIYDISQLLQSFGSVEKTRQALDHFRRRCREAGLPGLHLNLVVWGQPILPGEAKRADHPTLVKQLGFDSTTSYVWIHHAVMPELQTDYRYVQKKYFEFWDDARELYQVPYYPNVTMGWDSSPRADQGQQFGNFGYPFSNTIAGNTPKRFEQALRAVKAQLDKSNGPRILNINCWNEWTEGSYLEPDRVHGMKYLEAVRKVFGKTKQSADNSNRKVPEKTKRPADSSNRKVFEKTKRPAVAVACYYFPNWGDRGRSEWPKVISAPARFPDHKQPKTPSWGLEDERDPLVMARKIDVAADHGIDAFIFCHYRYNSVPHLRAALDQGFLRAKNNDRMKFALMWANHDVGKSSTTAETFHELTEECLEKYFRHPSYWKLRGKPYFSIYLTNRWIKDFGGIEKTAAAMRQFRHRVKDAGLPGVHLNLVLYGLSHCGPLPPEEVVGRLSADSVTTYTWIHHLKRKGFPASDYELLRERYFEGIDRGGEANGLEKPVSRFGVPYLPNVTMGWDSSPRASYDLEIWNKRRGYPFGSVVVNNTPANFKRALVQARDFAKREHAPAITINAWNEWTEGSYMEPEKRTGFGYLEAVQDVFGESHPRPGREAGNTRARVSRL